MKTIHTFFAWNSYSDALNEIFVSTHFMWQKIEVTLVLSPFHMKICLRKTNREQYNTSKHRIHWSVVCLLCKRWLWLWWLANNDSNWRTKSSERNAKQRMKTTNYSKKNAHNKLCWHRIRAFTYKYKCNRSVYEGHCGDSAVEYLEAAVNHNIHTNIVETSMFSTTFSSNKSKH